MGKLNAAYLAGLFDGEGHFYDGRSKVAKCYTVRDYRFQPKAGITMREECIMLAIVETLGGRVKKLKPRRPQHSMQYFWYATGERLAALISYTLPWLIAKREAALVIQEFQIVKARTKNQPISDADYAIQLQLSAKLRALNKKGVGKTLTRTVVPVTMELYDELFSKKPNETLSLSTSAPLSVCKCTQCVCGTTD